MLEAYEQHSKRKLIATILTIVVIAGFVVFTDQARAKDTGTASSSTPTSSSSASLDTNTTPTDSTTTTPPSTTNSTATSTGSYQDGTFTASSSYYVPHGNESIQVSITLKDGLITDSSVQNSEGDHESAQYQEDFTAVYKSYVVGKKISGLQLGIVAGASDTTQGFDDALSQIASKAQA